MSRFYDALMIMGCAFMFSACLPIAVGLLADNLRVTMAGVMVGAVGTVMVLIVTKMEER